jgi:DNA-binding LytR/AlgR family response regulator
MSDAQGTAQISLTIGRTRPAKARVWVVREAEAAYDALAGTGAAIDAPPVPRVPTSVRRPSLARHRIATAVPLDRLCIRDDRDVLLIPVRSVRYAWQDGDQTAIESDHQSLKVRLSLHRLEGVLAPFGFFRSHRAYLVNLRRVRRIVTWSRYVHNLMLDDPEETLVPLAKGRQSALRASLLWP